MRTSCIRRPLARALSRAVAVVVLGAGSIGASLFVPMARAEAIDGAVLAAETRPLRYVADPACPTQSRFEETMVEHSRTLPGPTGVVPVALLGDGMHVEIRANKNGFRGRLEVADAAIGRTSRVVDGPVCAEVVEALALTGALRWRPHAPAADPPKPRPAALVPPPSIPSESPGGQSPSRAPTSREPAARAIATAARTTTPPSAPTMAPTIDPVAATVKATPGPARPSEASPSPKRQPIAALAGLAGRASGMLSSRVLAGVEGNVGVSRRWGSRAEAPWTSARISISYARSDLPGGMPNAIFGLLASGFELCPIGAPVVHHIEVGACLQGEMGWLRGRGVDIAYPRAVDSLWLAWGAAAVLRFPVLRAGWEIEARGGFMTPPRSLHFRFDLPEQPVANTLLVGWSSAIGVITHFR